MKGSSLIELIIYAAILALITIVVVQTLLVVQTAFFRIQLIRAINTTGETVMQKMVREIRLASGIDLSGTVFDSNPGQLKLNTFVSASDSTPTTGTFSVASQALQFQRASQTAEILTPPRVAVTNLVFRNITQSANSKAVKVELGLSAQKGSQTVFSNFYATAILKNSY